MLIHGVASGLDLHLLTAEAQLQGLDRLRIPVAIALTHSPRGWTGGGGSYSGGLGKTPVLQRA